MVVFKFSSLLVFPYCAAQNFRPSDFCHAYKVKFFERRVKKWIIIDQRYQNNVSARNFI
jgi:hypothetical protein